MANPSETKVLCSLHPWESMPNTPVEVRPKMQEIGNSKFARKVDVQNEQQLRTEGKGKSR